MSDQSWPPVGGELITPPAAGLPTGDAPESSPAPKKGRWLIWLLAIVLLVAVFALASWLALDKINPVSEPAAKSRSQPASDDNPKLTTEPTTVAETLDDTERIVIAELNGLDLELAEIDEDQQTLDDDSNL
ncbi:MAG: hypothetical protein AAB499_00475 [Patescibacteria group bacterium]